MRPFSRTTIQPAVASSEVRGGNGNQPKRLNCEAKRRKPAVGVSKSAASAIHPVGALLAEIFDDMIPFGRRFMAAGTPSHLINDPPLTSLSAVPR